MRIEHFLLAFVVFSAIVTTGLLMVNDVNTNYLKEIGVEELSGTFNAINQTYGLSADMEGEAFGSDIETTDAFDASVKGAISTSRKVRGQLNVTGQVLNEGAQIIGIPSYWIVLAETVIVILLTVTIIYMFIRFKPQE